MRRIIKLSEATDTSFKFSGNVVEDLKNFFLASKGFTKDCKAKYGFSYGLRKCETTDEFITQLFSWGLPKRGRAKKLSDIESTLKNLFSSDYLRNAFDGRNPGNGNIGSHLVLKDFVTLYNSALEKLDYVFKTNFVQKYKISVEEAGKLLNVNPNPFNESYGVNFTRECQANPTYKKALAIVKKYGYKLQDNCYYNKTEDYVEFRVLSDNDDKLVIYFEQNGNKPEFEVQTNSYGIVDLKELKKFIAVCNDAYNMCQELSRLDFRTLHIDEE